MVMIAQALLDGFETGDADGDGLLSFIEARAIFPSLSESQFAALDSNKDGVLSLAELQEAINVNTGCACPASGAKGLRDSLGDLFLLGMSLLALLGWRGNQHGK